jgi:putative RecB family exonuclease
MKYKFRYIDKIIVIEKSIESLLGTAVHSALEWLYTQVKGKIIPELDEVLMCYSAEWKKQFDETITIVNGTKEDYYNKGIQFILGYYTKHHPFNDNTLELEKEISLKLDEHGEYQIIGYIDRLAFNLTTGEYEIHDYKTSNTLPNQEKIDSDRQLSLYSLAIKQLLGEDKEVVLIWHYLAHNTKIISRRKNEQLQNLKEQTLKLIKEIENTETFLPCVSKLCSWCEYKSMCPAFRNQNNYFQKKLGV